MKNNTRMFDNEVWSLKNVLKNVRCLKFDNEQEKFEGILEWNGCLKKMMMFDVWRSLESLKKFDNVRCFFNEEDDEVWWRWSLKKLLFACVCLFVVMKQKLKGFILWKYINDRSVRCHFNVLFAAVKEINRSN